MEKQTRIRVAPAKLPPLPPDGPLDPFLLLMLNPSGYRDPDDPNGGPDWKAMLLERATYGETLKKLKPRFRGTVPDRLTGKPDSMLAVDVTFDKTSNYWVQQLLERVPELKRLAAIIKELELFKQHMASKPGDRNRLETMLKEQLVETNGKTKA